MSNCLKKHKNHNDFYYVSNYYYIGKYKSLQRKIIGKHDFTTQRHINNKLKRNLSDIDCFVLLWILKFIMIQYRYLNT